MTATPRQLGFRMPAEWEPHAGTWLSWPHNLESWPGKFEPIPGIFAEIATALAPSETVHINVLDASMEASARDVLKSREALLDNIRFHRIPTNDAWCRDHGPIFLVQEGRENGNLSLIDWEYNAWGGKYPPYDLDNQVPARIAEILGILRFVPGIVMEGGSFDVNGRGSLLTTESCLLNPNRNPGLSRIEIENFLGEYLGVTNILWLGEGIAGDDTDGHIDDLARFVGANTIVTVVEEDTADENFAPLHDNLERLSKMRDENGLPFTIETLPMPPACYCQGQRQPASYANFYIANGTVLMPKYDPEKDGLAEATLSRLFPGRRIMGIDCLDLVWGLGALHCVTQQIPQP